MRIGGMFGRSPFGPLREHLLKTLDCLECVEKLLKTFVKGDAQKVERFYRRVYKLEDEADAIKSTIRTRLPHTFFSAVERSEIMTVLKIQDNVADRALHLAKTLAMRKTVVPEKLAKGIIEIAAKIGLVHEIFSDEVLRAYETLEKGIARKDASGIAASFENVHKQIGIVEADIEKFQVKMLSSEKQMDPVTVFFLIRITDGILAVTHELSNTVEAVDGIVSIT